MAAIGFSTGALAKGDFRRALATLVAANIKAVELSALRASELQPLIDALGELDLSHFDYISVHAPSSFSETEEARIAGALMKFADRDWPVIVHPDVIRRPELWAELGDNLLIENMDPASRPHHGRSDPVARSVRASGSPASRERGQRAKPP